jgi:hypothetical protein
MERAIFRPFQGYLRVASRRFGFVFKAEYEGAQKGRIG